MGIENPGMPQPSNDDQKKKEQAFSEKLFNEEKSTDSDLVINAIKEKQQEGVSSEERTANNQALREKLFDDESNIVLDALKKKE
jgi:hypothetical protein